MMQTRCISKAWIVTGTRVSGFGAREAITAYAALVVREKDSFVIIEALLPKTTSEAAAKESIHTAMEKNIQ